ncbi:hypothetical protein BC941DRAFT_423218 [Chlamydoabsidia padenii]|nr:hypothetical protein BC941DRAFT_423218 [Chlamydoabsidia padenii]
MLSPSILTSLSSTKSIQYQQHQQHQQYQIKQFISSIRQHLQDFASFLLTKESVHFTILSFALTYPGLVHFIHIKKGVISSPQIVDLNEMDKHHEILHEIFGTYDIKPQTSIDTVIGKWRWPSVGRLKKLCDTMLYIGLSHSRQQSSPPSIQLLQESTSQHQGFHYLYLSDQQLRQQHDSVDVDPSDELLAVYFSFVPRNRILAMHQQLLSDVSQRHFLK